MSVVRSLTNGLLYSNAWVALCLAALVLGYAHYRCITDCNLYALFAFLGTYATYNFHRLIRQTGFSKASIATERGSWMNAHRVFMFVSCALAIAGCIILLFLLPMKFISFGLLGVSAVIVLLYVIPLPFAGFTLREIPGLKNIWIVLVWLILVALPLLNRDKTPGYADLTLIGLMVFLQIIPFDIRDALYDRPDMYTLPQVAGIRVARMSATALLLLTLAGLLTTGHNWLLLLTGLTSLIGIWWRQRPSNIRNLEYIWELPLFLLGWFYYLLPCLPS